MCRRPCGKDVTRRDLKEGREVSLQMCSRGCSSGKGGGRDMVEGSVKPVIKKKQH